MGTGWDIELIHSLLFSLHLFEGRRSVRVQGQVESDTRLCTKMIAH